ncbi:dihydrofolate reductase family protein [Zafaria sp. Z1313]|uniref:dihydrofolate reductase family protein n=1 Tax=unclassified Zafaria TaxID=2828765 RepID=UPI002E79E4AE|nr:dihydrofolate reductase family protein [Zafaria sp. J156]MEE1622301.1 dihydrofolate reductase family protein [Zafaria sp. J156]
MGRLIYTAITSLEGYFVDADGEYGWSMPDEEVYAHLMEREASVATFLLGRRMYREMTAWEAPELVAEDADFVQNYAGTWAAAEKIVFSRTLDSVTSPRARIEREFDPDAVARLKESAEHDLSISGAELAAEAIRAGLVDEYRQYASPLVVGGGRHWLPEGVRLPLRLVEHAAFGNGVVYLAYVPA